MRKYATSYTSIAPLAVFRALFGFIMAVSVVRFALQGWIHELYVQPGYHFTFLGFDWIAPLGPVGMHVLFAIMGLAAVGMMVGWYYRIAAVVFFLSFTYVELIDKANYLNHYYFVSIISFLLIWVPANRSFSLDVRRNPELRADTVPAWTVNIFMLQLGLVYLFAGLAKLNPEWLFHAMPLRLWLPAHVHWPLVGDLLGTSAAAYVFSWAGALYDLTVVFFLLWNRTRIAAYAAVVAFHVMTALLFQIGMFPYIMILSTLIFFPASFHQRLLLVARGTWRSICRFLTNPTPTGRRAPSPRAVELGDVSEEVTGRQGLVWGAAGARGRVPGLRSEGTGAADTPIRYRPSRFASTALGALLVVHFALQLLIPLRALAYPGDLFWTEQGYRFSWRVMLMEKAGYATFHVHDPDTGRRWEVSNWEYLTPNQEKMMATQPDMILQFAHYLEEEYRRDGMEDVEITVDAFVTLNARRSRLMIDPNVDLTEVARGLQHKEWVLPFTDIDNRWIGRR